jgi:hypothetical protein
MTYFCYCGNTLFIDWTAQTRCGQCGAIYQRDPMSGGIAWMNCRVITTNTTLPNPTVDRAGASPAQVQRVVGQTEQQETKP